MRSFIHSVGDLKKKVNLSGECWDVKNERPQKRMSFLEIPFNVWTNTFMVEGSNPLHKRYIFCKFACIGIRNIVLTNL